MSIQITNEQIKQKYLFTSIQQQSFKLNILRQRRKQIQNKLAMVNNRISYRKKKQQSEIRKYIIFQQKTRTISLTRNQKRAQQAMKIQNLQKTMFQMTKRAKQVQDFRITKSKRLTHIYNQVKQRKNQLSQRARKQKREALDTLESIKQQTFNLKKQNYQQMLKLKQKQQMRKKCYWIQKKLGVQQKMIKQAQIYQKQTQDYYRRTLDLKNKEYSLKNQQQYAFRTLKTAQQNFGLLRRYHQ